MTTYIDYDDDIDPVANRPLMIRAIFTALKDLGGENSIDTIERQVASVLSLSQEQIDFCYKRAPKRLLPYRIGEMLNTLEEHGIVEQNEANGLWKLAKKYESKTQITEDEADEIYNSDDYVLDEEDDLSVAEIFKRDNFREKLRETIINMNPYEFERLCGELLSRCGFKNVKVTKKSNDGGIDGTADYDVIGVGSVSTVFQCKDFKKTKSVGEPGLRNFIGSDGFKKSPIRLFITTKKYREDAIQRADEENIILIGCEQLLDLCIKYQVGCKKVEGYSIDRNFFESLKDGNYYDNANDYDYEDDDEYDEDYY